MKKQFPLKWAFRHWIFFGSPVFFLLVFIQPLDAQVDCENQVQFISNPIYDVFFLDPLNGFIASRGEVLRTRDGGYNWEDVDCVTTRYGGEFHFPTSQVGYMSNRSSFIYKTSDAGENWDLLNLSNVTGDINDICFLNADTGYVALDSHHLLRTEDGGKTWEDSTIYVGYDGIMDVHFVNDTVGYVLGEKGFLVRINLNQAWDTLQVPISSFFNAREMWFEDVDRGWVIAQRTGKTELYRTTNGGKSWTTLAGAPNMYKWQSFDVDNIYAVGLSERMAKTSNGGWTWKTSTRAHYATDLHGLHFLNKNWGIAVGGSYSSRGRTIFKTVNGGQSWETLSYLAHHDLYDISFVNDSLVYVITEYSRILKSTDAGRNWEILYEYNLTPPVSGDNRGYQVQFFDELNGVGFSRELMMKTQDGGQTWDVSYHLLDHLRPNGIKFYNDSIWIKVNTEGFSSSIEITHDAGLNWVSATSSTSIRDVHIFSPDSMIGVTFQGIYFSEDGGNTWTQRYIANQEEYLTQIEFVNEKVGFVSGIDGLFFKSTDGGVNWTKMTIPTTVDLHIMKFYNEDLGYATRTDGYFAYKITNGGQTWTPINFVPDVKDIEIRRENLTYFVGRDGEIATLSPQETVCSPSFISGPDEVCLGTESYSVVAIALLDSGYIWEADGNATFTQNSNRVEVTWPDTGQYILSVRQTNGCDTSSMQQLHITVNGAITPTISIIDDSTLTTDAEGEIQWFLDGDSIANANEQTLSINISGTYTVESTSQCGTGISDEMTILNLEPGMLFTAYPNPAHSFLRMETSSEDGKWQLINKIGQTILKGTLIDGEITEINIKGLTKDIYFLHMFSQEGSVVKKILIQ